MNRPVEGDRVYITAKWWLGSSRKATVLGSEQRDEVPTNITLFLKVDGETSAVRIHLDHVRPMSVVEEIGELDGGQGP